jgi:hypothetical protein
LSKIYRRKAGEGVSIRLFSSVVKILFILKHPVHPVGIHGKEKQERFNRMNRIEQDLQEEGWRRC